MTVRKKKKTAGKKGGSAKRAPRKVFSFGGGKAHGKADMREILGGKGANLAEMSRPRHSGAAWLHDFDRSLRRVQPTRWAASGNREEGRLEGPVGSRGDHGGYVRRCEEPAPGLRSIGFPRLDAGHDGHGAQSRSQ